MSRLSRVLMLSCLAASPVCVFAQTPRVELDHVFIVVKPGAVAEIQALRSAGLTLAPDTSRHAGQGTASLGIFFENAYLELIWLDSSVSVAREKAETAKWFGSAAAWRTSGHSPFGIGLRRLAGDTASLRVPVERDAAPWLGPNAAYELLLQPADTMAADFFVVPVQAALPMWITRVRNRTPELLQHRSGDRRITLVRIHGPANHHPIAFRTLLPALIEMVSAREPLLELQLDNGVRGQRTDLRPILPMVIVR